MKEQQKIFVIYVGEKDPLMADKIRAFHRKCKKENEELLQQLKDLNLKLPLINLDIIL